MYDSISLREWADFNNVPVSTARYLCKSNRIPGAKKVGRNWTVPRHAQQLDAPVKNPFAHVVFEWEELDYSVFEGDVAVVLGRAFKAPDKMRKWCTEHLITHIAKAHCHSEDIAATVILGERPIGIHGHLPGYITSVEDIGDYIECDHDYYMRSAITGYVFYVTMPYSYPESIEAGLLDWCDRNGLVLTVDPDGSWYQVGDPIGIVSKPMPFYDFLLMEEFGSGVVHDDEGIALLQMETVYDGEMVREFTYLRNAIGMMASAPSGMRDEIPWAFTELYKRYVESGLGGEKARLPKGYRFYWNPVCVFGDALACRLVEERLGVRNRKLREHSLVDFADVEVVYSMPLDLLEEKFELFCDMVVDGSIVNAKSDLFAPFEVRGIESVVSDLEEWEEASLGFRYRGKGDESLEITRVQFRYDDYGCIVAESEGWWNPYDHDDCRVVFDGNWQPVVENTMR